MQARNRYGRRETQEKGNGSYLKIQDLLWRAVENAVVSKGAAGSRALSAIGYPLIGEKTTGSYLKIQDWAKRRPRRYPLIGCGVFSRKRNWGQTPTLRP